MVKATVQIRAALGSRKSILGKLRRMKEVESAYLVTGKWNIVCELSTASKTLHAKILKITNLPGVRETETLIGFTRRAPVVSSHARRLSSAVRADRISHLKTLLPSRIGEGKGRRMPLMMFRTWAMDQPLQQNIPDDLLHKTLDAMKSLERSR